MAVTAFNFAERYPVPVILMPDEIVGHVARTSGAHPGGAGDRQPQDPGRAARRLQALQGRRGRIAPLAAYGGEYVFHVSSSMHGLDGYSNNDPANAAWRVRQLHEKIDRPRDEIVLTRRFDTDDMDVLLVTLGATTRSGRAAALLARRQGVKAGVLRLQTVWPFPDQEIAELGRRAKMTSCRR